MKYLNIVMLLSVFFPYIQVIPLDSYTQPYPYIFAVTIIFFRVTQNKSILKVISKDNFIVISAFTLIGLLLFIINCFPYNNAQEYKYLINYIGPTLLTIAILSILESSEELFSTIAKYAVIIWVSVALIQALIYPSFLVSIIGVESSGDAVSNMSESGRGVFGLASEPTHHGFFMIILGATLAIRNSPKWLIYLCVFDALFIAKSSSALLCIIVGLIVLIAVNLGKVLIISSVSIFGVMLFLLIVAWVFWLIIL
jgi:hypothetical protein